MNKAEVDVQLKAAAIQHDVWKTLLKNLVKDVAFRGYAALFSLAALLPVKKNRVVLFSLHDASFTDGLGEIETELKSRGGYEILRVDRQDLFRGKKALLKFYLVDNIRMARAKWIFLNNNFFPFGFAHFNKDTKVVQVWHGQGGFKKFGLDMPQPKRERKLEKQAYAHTDYVVCSGPSCKPIYMSAFGMEAQQVIDCGNPVQDQYFGERVSPAALAAKRAAFDAQYSQCAGKYLVLYSPTFRDDGSSVVEHIDFARLREACNAGLRAKGSDQECAILVRLHPHDACSRSDFSLPGIVNVCDYPNSNELCFLSDIMITDYSSICMNMALLDKPMVFYAYDLSEFSLDRDFYFSYDTVGGPIVTNMDDLCEVFSKGDFADTKRAAFRELHFGIPQAGATSRLLDTLGV